MFIWLRSRLIWVYTGFVPPRISLPKVYNVCLANEQSDLNLSCLFGHRVFGSDSVISVWPRNSLVWVYVVCLAKVQTGLGQ